MNRISFLVLTFLFIFTISVRSADVINYTCEKNDVSFMVYTAKAPYYQVVMPNQTNPDTKYSARVKKTKTFGTKCSK